MTYSALHFMLNSNCYAAENIYLHIVSHLCYISIVIKEVKYEQNCNCARTD